MAVSNIVLNIITKGADLAKRQLDGIGKSGDKSSKGLGKFGKAMGVAVVGGALAMGKALTSATRSFIAFDDAMTQSLAIMDATEEQQQAMSETARKVALETTFSAEQTAESFFFLASAGLDAEQQIQALPQVAKFAQAGMFDMATATDLATDAQSALGLTVKDAQQNLDNLTRVTDVLVKANTLANPSVQQFSESLTSKAGSALKVVTKDIEEGVAVLAVFADAGVKGAEGGEKLNQVLRDIPRATAKNGDEFRKLGLEMFDAEGNMKNVADIVEELDRVLAPMSDELKASTLDQLGLNRGVADAVKILSGSTDKIREYESALRDSGGTTQEIADNQLGSLQNQLTIVGDKFNELGLQIIEQISPALQGMLKIVNDLLDGLLNEEEGVEDVITAHDAFHDALGATEGALFSTNSELNDQFLAEQKLKQEQEELIRSHKEFQDGMRRSQEEQNFLNAVQEDAIKNAHRYEIETMNTTQALQDQADATVELTEEEIALNKERQEKGLGALQKVQSAYQKIEDIQQNIVDLTTELSDAEDALEDAHNKNAQAIGTVEEMEKRLAEEKARSTIVTAEEELAIIKQRQAVQDLTDAQDGSREKELELQLAKAELTKRIEESTGATREEEQAQRDLDRAKADAVKAEEKLDKAKDTARKASEDLAKATDNSTENLLEMAIAQQNLKDALADASALGSFEDLVGLMADNVEGDLQRVIDKFNEILNLGGSKVTVGGNVATSNTFSPAGALDNSGSGSSSGGIGGFAGSMLATSGAVNINVNTGAVLGTEKAVEDAVTVALEKAKQRGLGIS